MKGFQFFILGMFFLLFTISSACSEKIIFQDDFSKYKTDEELQRVWRPFKGAWKLVDGKYIQEEEKEFDHGSTISPYIGYCKYSIEAKMRYLSGNFMGGGIYFAMLDRDTKSCSQMFRFDGEKNVIYGSFTPFAEYDFQDSVETDFKLTDKNWYTLKLIVDSHKKSCDLYVNDKLLRSDIKLRYTTGYVGLQCSSSKVTFSNFKVTLIEKQTPLEPYIERPKAVTIDDDGKIYVFRNSDGRVDIFDRKGNLIDNADPFFTPLSKRNILWSRIRHASIVRKSRYSGISIDKFGRLIIAEPTSNKITIFAPDPSSMYKKVGEIGVKNPLDVAVNDKGEIFVVNGGTTIYTYDFDGKQKYYFETDPKDFLAEARAIDWNRKFGFVIADRDRIVKIATPHNPKIEISFPARDTALIQWRPAKRGTISVEYGLSKEYADKIVKKYSGRKAKVHLRDLNPSTNYHFRVSNFLDTIPPTASGDYSFVTPPPPHKMHYTSLKVLGVIYTGTDKRKLSDSEKKEEIRKIKNSIELGRLFYFRNTSCQLNLDIEWMEIPTLPPPTEGPTMDNLAADLKSRGVKDDQYDGLYVTGFEGLGGNWGGFKVLGRTGACFAINAGVDYPGKDTENINYNQIWMFVHEFQHAVDLVICQNAGHPELLHGHPPFPEGYAGPVRDAGGHYNWEGYTFRTFDAWLDLRPYGEIRYAVDYDEDGVPDDDPDLPLDEKRLKGNPNKKDTDGDGLADLEEVIAGRFFNSDLTNPDTDGDGIRDGNDKYPLYPVASKIKPGKCEVNGLVDSTSHVISPGLIFTYDDEFEATVYGAYQRDKCLQFEVVTTEPCAVEIRLDGNGENGWWMGGASYTLRIAKEEEKIKKFNGKQFEIENAIVKRTTLDGKYLLEIQLPKKIGQGYNPTGEIFEELNLQPDAIVGLNFKFYKFEDSDWAHAFEPEDLADVELTK